MALSGDVFESSLADNLHCAANKVGFMRQRAFSIVFARAFLMINAVGTRLSVLSLSQPIGTVIGATSLCLLCWRLCRHGGKCLSPSTLLIPTKEFADQFGECHHHHQQKRAQCAIQQMLDWFSVIQCLVCLLSYWLLRDLRHYFSGRCDHSLTDWRWYNELPRKKGYDCLTVRQLLWHWNCSIWPPRTTVCVWWVPQLLWPQIDFLADES